MYPCMSYWTPILHSIMLKKKHSLLSLRPVVLVAAQTFLRKASRDTYSHKAVRWTDGRIDFIVVHFPFVHISVCGQCVEQGNFAADSRFLRYRSLQLVNIAQHWRFPITALYSRTFTWGNCFFQSRRKLPYETFPPSQRSTSSSVSIDLISIFRDSALYHQRHHKRLLSNSVPSYLLVFSWERFGTKTSSAGPRGRQLLPCPLHGHR